MKTQVKTSNKIMALLFTFALMLTIQFNTFAVFAKTTTANVSENSFMKNVLTYVASIAGGIVAIFLIISIVKDALGYAKGQGQTSVFKILGKVLFLILMIGIIFIAVNYKSLGDNAKSIGEKGINTVVTEASKVLN